MNNDSDKDVNNEKDDMFETITAKEQVMIFLMTKDSFLLQGFWQLGNDSNLLIVFYVQIMPDDLVMQLHRF